MLGLVVFLLFLIGMVVGFGLAIWLDIVLDEPSHNYELDAMEAADRLFEASDQARQDMRETAERQQRSRSADRRAQAP